MKFYLSSYLLGNATDELVALFLENNKKMAYIPNARDALSPNLNAGKNSRDIQSLLDVGLDVEVFDLKKYFRAPEKLAKDLKKFSGVFIAGGNTFVLRKAFFLSGFDVWIEKNLGSNFIYAGYSAACCILSPSLKGLQIVDEPEKNPYEKDFPESQEIVCSGLEILDYMFLPHYKSNHPESADIDKEVKYSIANKIPFKAFCDGEVEIFEKTR